MPRSATEPAAGPSSASDSQLIEEARRAAEELVRPRANRLDETEEFPADLYAEFGQRGLFGITLPTEYGGRGANVATYVEVIEELAAGYACVADQVGLVELVGTVLTQHATEQQRQRYLPGLLAGTLRASWAVTEPEAGSDAGSVSTRAIRTTDGGWQLTGRKIHIHNAPVADVAVVLAVTDPELGKRGGLSLFLVDIDEGCRGQREPKMGQRASQLGGFVFDARPLPADAVLGGEGQGFSVMGSILAKGRAAVAALSCGIARAALDAATAYATERQQFGKPLADHQVIAFGLADSATELRAAELLTRQAAQELDAEHPDAAFSCAMAKLYAAELCVQHTSRAVQVFGGNGYLRGYEVERLYRDARITPIFEGTSQMQRLIISRGHLRAHRQRATGGGAT